VAEICRKAGISQATYFNWKKKYSGMLPSEMKRLLYRLSYERLLRKLVSTAPCQAHIDADGIAAAYV
jgi:putative transposase